METQALVISLAFVVASLGVIFWAADLIVLGISHYAKRLGLSDYIIGLVVIAMAASMPEILASLTALAAGKNDVMLGAILGTNMVHTALGTGTAAIIGRKLNVESTILGKVLVPLWLVLMLPFAMMIITGRLGRIEGAILVALFVIYLVWLWHQEGKLGKMKKNILLKWIWRDAVIFLGSLVALLIASRTLVFSTLTFSTIIGIPAYFLSLTVIGVGGALPDFAVAIRSVRQGHQDIGMGDVLGSIIIEFLLFFGLVGLLAPMQVAVGEVLNAMIFLSLTLAFLLYIIHKGTMTWKHGIIMVCAYAVFITIELFKVLR